MLYTNHGASGTVEDISTEFDHVLDEVSADDRVIALRLLQIFEGIIEEKETEEAEALKVYKQIELGQVPDAINHVDWDQSIVDVAGQIMSSLVLKHILPNANHRTSISLAEWYLESTESGFSFPELATDDYDWRSWVDEYIVESKRLLTVRRNATAFSFLQEWGCNVVERKGGIEIELDEYDLDLGQSKAYSYYSDLHTELCVEFMIESAERAGHDELLSTSGPTKEEFVEYLRQSE